MKSLDTRKGSKFMENRISVIDLCKYESVKIAECIQSYIEIKGCKNIFIKPNMVINPWKEEENDRIVTVTNASLIEAVLIMLQRKAASSLNITIGDAL